MQDSIDPVIRRRRLLQAIGAAGVTGLAGCISSTGGDNSDSSTTASSGSDTNTTSVSSTTTSSASSTTANSSSGTTVQMENAATGWAWNTAAKSLNDAADTYNKQNSTQVSVKELGKDTWRQRFQTSITSGNGAPDLSPVQNYDVASFANKNGLMDLTDRLEAADLPSKFVSGKMSTGKYKGKYYGVPWDVGPTGVFYVRDVYEKAGVDPSSIKTWDDFIQEGKKLPDDVSMVNIPHEEISQMWRMLLRQLGGQAFTESGAVNVGGEESVRVAQLMQKMKKAGITTRIKLWASGWFTSFANGRLASLPSAVWMDGTLRSQLPDTKGNWGVYKLPAFEKGGSRVSNRGGSFMAIPAQIEDKPTVNRAYDFIEYAMTSPDLQNQFLQDYGLFPSLKSAYGADIYSKKLDFYDGQAIFQLFADIAPDIKSYRYTSATSEVNDAINTELGRMLSGKKSPKQAVTDAAKTVADRTNRDLA